MAAASTNRFEDISFSLVHGESNKRKRIENWNSHFPNKIENHRDLPDEILFEIIIYLNAKDLQNYKSVSNLWCFSISHPDFVNKHLNMIQQKQSELEIILTTHKTPRNQLCRHEFNHFSITNTQNNMMMMMRPMELNFPFRHTVDDNMLMALSLQATCDGLLLFQDKYNPHQLYISNPVTSQFEPLPKSVRYCPNWALVRDTLINKYKVFGVNSYLKCDVLTLGDETSSGWKSYGYRRKIEKLTYAVFSQIVVVGKVLYWLSSVNETDNQASYIIYSINVENLIATQIKLPTQFSTLCPTQFSTSKGLHLLSEVKRSLCLTFVSPLELKLFVRETQPESVWTQAVSIHLHSLSNHPPFLDSFLSDSTCLVPIKGAGGSNLSDLVKVFIHHKDQLFVYDLNTQDCRSIGFLSKEQKLLTPYFFHSNSLVCW